MSSVWSGDVPKFGVTSDCFQGIGSPRIGRPPTTCCAEPPTGG
jgi:hypothetical protein